MVNVVPIHDTQEHQHIADCWCDPSISWIDEDTGLPFNRGPLVVHNSADGREALEEQGITTGKGWGVYAD